MGNLEAWNEKHVNGKYTSKNEQNSRKECIKMVD